MSNPQPTARRAQCMCEQPGQECPVHPETAVSESTFRIVRTGEARLELLAAEQTDDRPLRVAIARKCVGRDTWMVQRHGKQRTEFIEGEPACWARLREIGEQQPTEESNSCAISMPDASLLELRDETGLLVALARKVTGRDIWHISKQGSRGAVEWRDNELLTRARLHEIGEQWS